MKLNNQKGFTLIELIMVIVILGILAATVVPRFFDFSAQAHEASRDAIFGATKSGLNLYAADKLANKKGRLYPLGGTGRIANVYDDFPEDWTIVSAAATFTDTIKSTVGDYYILYTSPSATDTASYTLTKKTYE